MTNTRSGRPVRVLQVFNNLGMGGAETWLIEMLRRWHVTGEVQCDFLVTSDEPGTFDDEARRLGAQILVNRFSKGQLISFARRFRQILRDGNYDAIHDHQDRVSGWHFALGWPHLPAIRISHIHNPSYQIASNYEVNLSRRLTAAMGKFFMRRFTTHITSTSYQVIEEYGFTTRAYAHIPKAALHCAFDCRRFSGCAASARSSLTSELGIPPDAKIILFAGRMDHSAQFDHPLNHKNSALAIEVVSQCLSKDSRIHLVMAGATTAALPLLEERIRNRGYQNNFHFLGIRKDIQQLMLASNLLLFPSRGEGLGMVAVEAQAAGLRVLASSAVPRECVVIPELVTFMDLSQAVEKWAAKVEELLNLPIPNREAANAMVARSAFSVPVCSDRLTTLYAKGQL